MTRTGSDVVELDAEQCWRLLRTHDLGRLAVVGASGADVFPLNYLIYDDGVYFRTAPGSKLDSLGLHPAVAFEIDGRSRRRVWSVVMHGTARSLTDADLVASSGVSRMLTDLPGEKHHYLTIDGPELTGRSFIGTRRPWNIRSIVVVGVAIAVLAAVLGVLGQLLGIG